MTLRHEKCEMRIDDTLLESKYQCSTSSKNKTLCNDEAWVYVTCALICTKI